VRVNFDMKSPYCDGTGAIVQTTGKLCQSKAA
jgi:CDGSH-type Zn-finger protein